MCCWCSLPCTVTSACRSAAAAHNKTTSCVHAFADCCLLLAATTQVIEHDVSSAAAVENEVQLMFLFNHPNIVRAYHCVTYGKTSSSAARSGDAKDARSAAGTTAGTQQLQSSSTRWSKAEGTLRDTAGRGHSDTSVMPTAAATGGLAVLAARGAPRHDSKGLADAKDVHDRTSCEALGIIGASSSTCKAETW